MKIGKGIEKYFTAALNELVVHDIDYTRKFIEEIGVEQRDGTYVCDRVVEQDYSYLFYFKAKNAHYYYRVLVMKEDAFVYSAKIVSGNSGRIRIKNDHNPRSFDDWKHCFKETACAEVMDKTLYIRLTEHTAYDINEIVGLLTESMRDEKKELFSEYSLENDCVLEIETFMPREYDSETEIEKWRIIDLAQYRLGLEITNHVE
jgi:hypothetical protein